ncbi:glycosyltransferase [Marinobacter nauticus]|uniref:glycosyltransferase n=1 Tax=Marinobacter nauticus TaxID=2743 RepID=UPI001CFEAE56|nr:glycosyltransferase [Marinobacter nauticus]
MLAGNINSNRFYIMKDSVDVPFVSVVVPVFNESKYISDCLRALLRQDYPKNRYEVIVVDNGSTDDSVSIAKEFTDKVFIKENVKVGGVRNYGVKQAKGEILAFIDGDCVAGEHWLSKAVEVLANENVGGVGGGCLLRDRPSWVERGWKLNSIKETRKVKALAGGSFIVGRSLFEKLGGFNELINAGEDTRLSVDITDLGFELWFTEECYVVHLGYPSTLRGFFQREFWHASSYLKSNYGFKDKMFLTVILFLVSSVSFFTYLFTGFSLALIGSVFIVLCPLAFFINQVRSQGLKGVPLQSLFFSLVLSFVYYLGRGGGFLSSVFRGRY